MRGWRGDHCSRWSRWTSRRVRTCTRADPICRTCCCCYSSSDNFHFCRNRAVGPAWGSSSTKSLCRGTIERMGRTGKSICSRLTRKVAFRRRRKRPNQICTPCAFRRSHFRIFQRRPEPRIQNRLPNWRRVRVAQIWCARRQNQSQTAAVPQRPRCHPVSPVCWRAE